MRSSSATFAVLTYSAIALVLPGSCAPNNISGERFGRSLAVPDICDADMRVKANATSCARALVPIGIDYGKTAIAQLDAVRRQIPDDKLQQAMQTRATIEEKCIRNGRSAVALNTSMLHSNDTEVGVGTLPDCFFYARLVLKNFGGGDEGKALAEATNRSFYGLNVDDEFLIPPPNLVLGAK